jgi:hypothetical protein
MHKNARKRKLSLGHIIEHTCIVNHFFLMMCKLKIKPNYMLSNTTLVKSNQKRKAINCQNLKYESTTHHTNEKHEEF